MTALPGSIAEALRLESKSDQVEALRGMYLYGKLPMAEAVLVLVDTVGLSFEEAKLTLNTSPREDDLDRRAEHLGTLLTVLDQEEARLHRARARALEERVHLGRRKEGIYRAQVEAMELFVVSLEREAQASLSPVAHPGTIFAREVRRRLAEAADSVRKG